MKKIYTCVVGDLFHAGHVNYLRQCKALGDFLLVGICSDEDCLLYKRKTILSLKERATVVESCKYVDQIILCPPSIITNDFIDKNQIDIVSHGDDSNQNQLYFFYAAAIQRGIYQSVPYTQGISTTDIINRIRARMDNEVVRKNFLS